MRTVSMALGLAVLAKLLALGPLGCSSDTPVTSDAGAVADGAAEAGGGDSGALADAARESGGSGEADAALDASAPVDAGGDVAPQDASADADSAAPLYRPCPAAGAACVIMPIGDSITFGYQSSTGGGYRIRLLQDLWAANKSATFVGDNSSGPATLDGKAFPKANEGHSGYTIDDAPAVGRSGISPLVPAALGKDPPNVVTLMIGTNDVDLSNDLANAPVRLGTLIDTITTASPDALVVVAQITPTGTDAENLRVQAYNAAIPELVKSRAGAGKHVILVDMYGALTANPSYRTDDMADGLHPNDTGYAVLGDAWYKALAPYL